MTALVVRTVLFVALVPGTVTVLLPLNVFNAAHAAPDRLGWLRFLGCIPIAAGVLAALWATAEFVVRGRGTPAIWFTRPLRFLFGSEPRGVVRGTIYSYTRNPMYLGVLAILFGEALLFASPELLAYALLMCVFFEIVVVFIEEPHLRRTRGEDYTVYCRKAPRWMPAMFQR